jgi:hypothetical protein
LLIGRFNFADFFWKSTEDRRSPIWEASFSHVMILTKMGWALYLNSITESPS